MHVLVDKVKGASVVCQHLAVALAVTAAEMVAAAAAVVVVYWN